MVISENRLFSVLVYTVMVSSCMFLDILVVVPSLVKSLVSCSF